MPRNRLMVSDSLLLRLYQEEQLPLTKVAEALGVSVAWVHKRLRELKVPLRNRQTAQQLSRESGRAKSPNRGQPRSEAHREKISRSQKAYHEEQALTTTKEFGQTLAAALKDAGWTAFSRTSPAGEYVDIPSQKLALVRSPATAKEEGLQRLADFVKDRLLVVIRMRRGRFSDARIASLARAIKQEVFERDRDVPYQIFHEPAITPATMSASIQTASEKCHGEEE